MFGASDAHSNGESGHTTLPRPDDVQTQRVKKGNVAGPQGAVVTDATKAFYTGVSPQVSRILLLQACDAAAGGASVQARACRQSWTERSSTATCSAF